MYSFLYKLVLLPKIPWKYYLIFINLILPISKLKNNFIVSKDIKDIFIFKMFISNWIEYNSVLQEYFISASVKSVVIYVNFSSAPIVFCSIFFCFYLGLRKSQNRKVCKHKPKVCMCVCVCAWVGVERTYIHRERQTDELTFVMHFEWKEHAVLFLFLCLNKFKFVISWGSKWDLRFFPRVVPVFFFPFFFRPS